MDILIIFLARYAIFLIGLLGLIVLWRATPAQRKFLLISGLIAVAIGYGLVLLAGHLHHHPQPYIVRHTTPLIPPHAGTNAFPSEHTFAGVLIALVVMQVSWRWGLGLLVLGLGVGIARVAAGVHWWSDVTAGALIAIAATGLAYFITRELIGKPTQEH